MHNKELSNLCSLPDIVKEEEIGGLCSMHLKFW